MFMARPYPWKPEDDALIGTAPDSAIGKRLGVTDKCVQRRRYRLGIEPFVKHAPGRSVDWTEAALALLGQMSDGELGRRLGLSPKIVRAQRNRLGVAAFCPAGAPSTGWTAEREAKLGTVPDRVLAQEMGCSKSKVAYRRRCLDIPPHNHAPRGILPGHVALDRAKLRARREALGLTRSALAGRKAPIACLHLGRIESGHLKTVKPETLTRLCAILKCQPEDIIAGPAE